MILEKLKDMNCECVGCGNCVRKCENGALCLETDKEGFLTAVFNEGKCEECGKCVDVCPQTELSTDNFQRPECYAAAAAQDITAQSTAGGVFSVLAQSFIADGGYVCGVAMNGNRAEYTLIQNEEGIEKLRGAKYIEAEIGNTFEKIRYLLEQGKKVMFCGTPCHVVALYKYLEETENVGLITVDFVCHGVSSPYVFDVAIRELENGGGKMKKYNFTPKDYGFRPDMCKAEFEDGSVVFDKDFIFYHNTCMSLRQSCYNCKFASLPRLSDITLGVFYGIEKFDPSIDTGSGLSMVLLNSTKGRELIMKNRAEFPTFIKTPIRFALENNRFFNLYLKNKKRTRMFEFILDKRPLEDIKHYIRNDAYDITVAANWSASNYGAHLTHYAIYSVLMDMGYEVLMLEKPNVEPWKPLTEPILFRNNPYPDYALSPLFNSLEEMKNLNMRCGTFIVASDQVWNYELFGHSADFYTLSFAGEDKTKISYATSFGSNKYSAPDEIKQKFANKLKTFNSVSVREDTGVDICKKEFNVQAQHVLDPVFIADSETFEKLIKKSKARKNNKYVFIYIIWPDKKTEDMLVEYAEKNDYELVCIKDALTISNALKDKWTLPTVNAYVEDWLYYLKNASYVFADSFHAVCFSIIYRKNFTCFINPEIDGSCRMTSLLKQLGLENRIVTSINDCYDKEGNLKTKLMGDIDYDAVYEKLDVLIDKSKEWLKNALFGTLDDKESMIFADKGKEESE